MPPEWLLYAPFWGGTTCSVKKRIKKISRPLFLAFGFIWLFIGLVGVFVPLLPTTPFILLAAYCFSKGSRRVYYWLLGQKVFGPMIVDWQEHKVIAPRVKLVASVGITVMLSFPILYMPIPIAAKIVAGCVGLGVIIFIQSCPSEKEPSRSKS